MTTSLAERLPELSDLLDRVAADDRRRLEDAYLAVLAKAPRHRPTSMHPQVRSHPPERVALARARTLAAELQVRAELVADSLSTAELATTLGVSAAAVTKRRERGGLAAFRHRGDWRYPRWQLRSGELLPGVAEVWQSLPDHDALSLTRWFGLPSTALEGATPLALLQAGEVGRVAEAATYVGGR